MLIITVASSNDHPRDFIRFRRYIQACENFPGSVPVRFRTVENKKVYNFKFSYLSDIDPEAVIETISEFFVKGEKAEIESEVK